MLVFFTGHYFVFKTIQKQYKKNFKEYLKTLPEEKWESIEIASYQLYKNTSEITWVDNNKEIEMNGQLYDVVKIKQIGNKVKLYLVNDNDEKTLKNNYNKLAKNIEGNSSQKNNNKVLNDFITLKVIIGNPLGAPKQYMDTAICFAPESKTLTNAGFTTVNTPPPIIM